MSSKIPRTRIARSIAATSLKDGFSKHYATEIAAYLLSEGRVDELDSLLRDVSAVWAKQDYLEVLASTAFSLSETVKADITRVVSKLHPEAKHVIITEVHDPEIVGGVRLNLPNEQLDLSVQAKLNKFKQLTAAGKE